MTALNDYMGYVAPENEARMLDGGRLVARSVQKVGGIALLLAAVGMWLQPGALLDADVALLKMGVSLGFGMIAIALLQNGLARPAAKVVIDIARGEVRLVRITGGLHKSRSVISRIALGDIGRAEQSEKMIRLWTKNDDLIAEVALTNSDLRRDLVGALEDAGKL